MRSIVLAAVLALMGFAVRAQPIGVDVATISMSAPGVPRTVTNTLCATDGTDLVCDRGAQLLPNGVISATNISATRISGDGSQLTNLPSASASPTNVPAFRVHRNFVDQTIPTNTMTKIQFTTEEFDTYNSFDNATNYRFQPTVAGKYLIALNAYCMGTGGPCGVEIRRSGTAIAQNFSNNQNTDAAATVVVDLNGSTDYIEGYVYSGSTTLSGATVRTYMSGSLLASGNGLISGSTALGDRITSGTASGVVAMAGGTVSFTTGGTSGTAYLDTLGRFIGAGVSTTGAISAASVYAGASLQLASPTAVTACTSAAAGTIRYNSLTTTLELCTGSGWQPMGVGIPAGTISAFASTTCPTGWSEYAAARGRFLRGIDNGAGNDADGTRAPGAIQADSLASHRHYLPMGFDGGNFYGWLDGSNSPVYGSRVQTGANRLRASAPAEPNDNVRLALTEVSEAPVSGETRPRNVAVTFCQFNGTSNGWNNPLSGGGTSAAGSTGQLQYNTAGSFDASAGLTWTNASSLLGVAGTVSTTSITVGGKTLQEIMASATTAKGDRIVSGTTAATVNSATTYISLTTGSTTWGYLSSGTSYLPSINTAKVSATTMSTTAVQIFSPTTALACSSDLAGTIRYNSPTTTLELCTGSGWQPMGVGIPAGTISAFASTTCPTGWSEYTAARGRFLRGIDNGAGNDPDGTRAPGGAQADELKSHTHPLGPIRRYAGSGGSHPWVVDGTSGAAYEYQDTYGAGGAETRPKNVAVTYCQFNGTSNGWNNPLSGGTTSAAGSTGQVQYNTAGSFDASPDFSWTNGSKVLGVTGAVSTASVKLSGVGGNCSTADDLGRMFRNATTGRLQLCLPR